MSDYDRIHQTIVEIASTVRALGKSSTTSLKESFEDDMLTTDEAVRVLYQQFVLDASHPMSEGDSGGYGFTSFTTDYVTNYGGAPDIIAEVEVGGEGLPAGPFMPNPRIDGMPFTEDIPVARYTSYGSADHSATDSRSMPSVTSAKIQAQTLVGYPSDTGPGYLILGAAYERPDVALFPPPPLVYEPPPIDWTSPTNLGLAAQALVARQAAAAALAVGDESLAASLLEKAVALEAEAASQGHVTDVASGDF